VEPGSLPDYARSLPISLLRAREALMLGFRPILRAHGITEQQWRVLRALESHGEQEATELAHLSALLPSSLSRILRTMERQGWIKRRADKADLRRARISITARGQALISTITPHSEAKYAEIEELIGPDRMERLLADLDFLIDMEPE
jgi:homoprotocatechuate degradation regulator HpaR